MDTESVSSRTPTSELQTTALMVLSTIFCFLLVFLATPALLLLIARSLF